MGYKYCPNCKRVVVTKVLAEGYAQIDHRGIRIKRRKITHLVEDGGCGHTWMTYEIPEEYVLGIDPGRG